MITGAGVARTANGVTSSRVHSLGIAKGQRGGQCGGRQ
jgi:hypothetical protein